MRFGCEIVPDGEHRKCCNHRLSRYLDTVSRWAHARRERADAGSVSSSFPMTQQWQRKDQSAVSRFVMKIIKGRSAEQELESLRRVLIDIIEPSADEWTK